MTRAAHADQLKAAIAPFITAAQSFAEDPVRRALDDMAAIAGDALVVLTMESERVKACSKTATV